MECPLKIKPRIIHFPPLAKVSTDDSSVALQLHIRAREEHSDVMMKLNMLAVKLQRFRKDCCSVNTIMFVQIKTSQ